jgi:hypothetical protein
MHRQIARVFYYTEILGLGVLTLVLLALFAIQTANYLHVPSTEYFAYIIMTLLVVLSIVFGLLHAIQKLGFLTPIRIYFGVILLLTGGWVFFILPEYFYILASSSLDFWYKVSIYSLPAICVEGGLFTLYTEYIERENDNSNRENTLLSIAFLLYASGAITTNFLVLTNIITPDHQIIITRGILIVSGVIGFSLYRSHTKRKPLSQ